MQYYIHLNPSTRMMYKRMRGVFTEKGATSSVLIEIRKDERKEEDKESILKKVGRSIKKILGA